MVGRLVLLVLHYWLIQVEQRPEAMQLMAVLLMFDLLEQYCLQELLQVALMAELLIVKVLEQYCLSEASLVPQAWLAVVLMVKMVEVLVLVQGRVWVQVLVRGQVLVRVLVLVRLLEKEPFLEVSLVS